MKKMTAIILGAFIFLAVPFASSGSGDATTIKTELSYQLGECNLSTAVSETVLSSYDHFTNFNYVTLPTLETSFAGGYVDALHSRWYIDIRETFSCSKDVIDNSSAIRPTYDSINTSVNMWCWSACV